MANPASKVYNGVTTFLIWVAFIGLLLMILTVLIDVFGRYLFNSPLIGGMELVQMFMGSLGGTAILYCAMKGGHVAIDVIFNKFPAHTRRIIGAIYSFAGFCCWAAMGFYFIIYTLDAFQKSEIISIINISPVPELGIITVAVLMTGITYLMQVFHPVEPEIESDQKE